MRDPLLSGLSRLAPRVLLADLLAGDRSARDPAERGVLAAAALEASGDGSRTSVEAAGLARRALTGAAPAERDTITAAAAALARCDAYAEAEQALTGVTGAEVARGAVLYRRGDLAGAAAVADAAPAGTATALAAWCALERGDASGAAAVLGDVAPAGELATGWLLVRAALHAAAGDHDAALDAALTAGRTTTVPNPAAIPWRSVAAVAAAHAGRTGEARRLAATELLLARRFGAPRAVGVAARALGLATADGELLTEAVSLLRGAGAQLELGRALVELGAHVRRSGERRQARDVLREALDLAERLGAAGLAASAREELGASGAKPRRDALSGAASLTPSERRVAVLAAAGRSNREIAGELFVTMRTVTTHLTQVYRKLDIDGREQLAGALGDDGFVAPDGDGPVAVSAAEDPAPTAAPPDPATVLGPLSPTAHALATAVAILGGATLTDAASLAGLDATAADTAWSELGAAGVVTAAGGRLTVPERALAFALDRALTAAEADRAHAGAARLLAARGEHAAAAEHLHVTLPAGDAGAVTTLLAAAEAARRAGAPAVAARHLRRALAEQPAPPVRATAVTALADAARLAREPDAAALVAEAVAATGAGAAALADVHLHGGRLAEARAVADAAVTALGAEADPAVVAPLEALRVAVSLLGDTGGERLGPHRPRLRLLAVAAGPAGDGLRSVERFAGWADPTGGGPALGGGRFGQAAPTPAAGTVDLAAAAALALAQRIGDDDEPGARRLLAVLTDEADREGDVACRLHALVWGSHLALRVGRIGDALADGRAALALAERTDLATFRPLAAAFLADALLARGAVAEAAATIDSAAAALDGLEGTAVAAYVLYARGSVRLAEDRRDEAVATLRACRAVAAHCFADDPNVLPSRSRLAEALAPDDPAAARALVDEELVRARRRPRALGTALHARARLEDGDVATATLREAAAVLASSPAVPARAAVLLDLGTPEATAEALQIALTAGATALAARAADALAAASA